MNEVMTEQQFESIVNLQVGMPMAIGFVALVLGMILGFGIVGSIASDTFKRIEVLQQVVVDLQKHPPEKHVHREFHYVTQIQKENHNGKSEETDSDHSQDRNGQVPVHREEGGGLHSDLCQRDGETVTP